MLEVFFTPMEIPPVRANWLAKSCQRSWSFIKRWVALVSAAVAIYYVVAGSLLFGQWWCVFFWRGGYKDSEFITDGLWVLLDYYFPLVLVSFCVLLLAIVVCALLRRRLFKITDRFWGAITCFAIVTILLDAIILYHTQFSRLTDSRAGIAELRESIQRAQAAFTPPTLNSPIYFRYLDTMRVDALYNQIQSELEEKERTVLRSNTLKGEATAEVGGAKLGTEGEKANESTSTFDRSDFSSDRKCLEVMKYVREIWPASYYTIAPRWYLKMMVANEPNWYQQLFSGWPIDLMTKALEAPTSEGTPEAGEIEAAQPSQRSTELKLELQLLRGLIFVDGDYYESLNGEGTILTEEFSRQPFKASFRVFLPTKALQQKPATTPLQLTVFGDVTKPLGADGVVDISAIAAY